jgi:hypothetical protein
MNERVLQINVRKSFITGNAEIPWILISAALKLGRTYEIPIMNIN